MNHLSFKVNVIIDLLQAKLYIYRKSTEEYWFVHNIVSEKMMSNASYMLYSLKSYVYKSKI